MHQTIFRINLLQELSMWVPVIAVFYLNYSILIPKLLTRRRFALYTLTVSILVAASFFSIRIFDYYYFEPRFLPSFEKNQVKVQNSLPPSVDDNYHNSNSFKPFDDDSLKKSRENNHLFIPPTPAERTQMRMIRREIDIFVLLVLSIAVSTSIKITGKWYSNEKERKEMENQKLTAELSLLKSQINPHFFFNTLNNIYSLAIQKSRKTPEAIVKLSELMRYIIYESDKDLVPLKKELEYIRNYVELQQLRLMSNVKITYQIEGIYSDVMIEPLLFLPFIENAFKHGIDYTKDCEIKIKFAIDSDLLVFTVENPLVQQSKKQAAESSGIGLANTKKRLQLLYGDKYELKVNQKDDHFTIELALKIREYELYNS